MAKFNVGDKVRMAPDLQGTDYAQFRNKVGTIVGVGTYEYDVTFPENPGEAYEFYEEEMTRVKSLPTTDTKSLRAKYKAAPKEIDYDKPILKDYYTNKEIRNATRQELLDSRSAAKSDGGAGVIDVNGRSCFVEE